MPLAYSYIRFSTPRQAAGDSYNRQIKLRDEWLAANPQLNLQLAGNYEDLGLSAAAGKNHKDGALGLFLDQLKKGKIPTESYLLVENLDRITRQSLRKAVLLVMGILDAGVNIVTMGDAHIYKSVETSSNDTMLSMMGSMMILARAGDESQRKSDLGKANWITKRANAVKAQKVLSKVAPAWLTFDEDAQQFVPEPTRVAAVRRIYELSAQGHGAAVIIQRLIAEGYKPINTRKDTSQAWSRPYVKNILSSRAVLGEFVPGYRNEDGKQVLTGDVIEGYYPQVIDANLWGKSQAAQMVRKSSVTAPKNRSGEYTNLLAGRCRCVECGGIMTMTYGAKPHLQYLRCDNRYNLKTCKLGRRYNYTSLEKNTLDALQHLLFDASQANNNTEVSSVETAIAETKLQIERETNARKKLLIAFADSDDQEVTELLGEKLLLVNDLRKKLTTFENQRLQLNHKPPIAEHIARMIKIRADMSSEDADTRINARAEIAQSLQSMVTLVGFYGDGSIVVEVENGYQFVVIGPDVQLAWVIEIENTATELAVKTAIRLNEAAEDYDAVIDRIERLAGVTAVKGNREVTTPRLHNRTTELIKAD